jgi:O-antigen/teichoic acid export membrane protein
MASGLIQEMLRAIPALFANRLAAFAVVAFLGGWLGPAALGKYLFAVGVIQIACVAGGLGLTTAGVRLLPLYVQDGERHLFRGFIRFAGLAVVLASAGVGLSLSLGVHAYLGSEASLPPVWWIATLISIGLLLNGIFRAVGFTWLATIPQGSFRSLATLSLAGLGLVTVGELTSRHAVLAFGGATLLGVLLQLFVGGRGRRALFLDHAEYRPREWLGTGMQYYPMDLARAVALHGPTIALRLLESSEAAGHYGAVMALVNFLLIPERAGLVAAQRQFAPLFRSGGLRGIEPLLSTLTKVSLVVGIPALVGFSVFPHLFLSLVSADFAEAGALVPILGAATFLGALNLLPLSALSMTQHVTFARRFSVTTQMLGIAVAVIAVLNGGIYGVAWTLLGITCLRSTVLATYWATRRGQEPGR